MFRHIELLQYGIHVYIYIFILHKKVDDNVDKISTFSEICVHLYMHDRNILYISITSQRERKQIHNW